MEQVRVLTLMPHRTHEAMYFFLWLTHTFAIRSVHCCIVQRFHGVLSRAQQRHWAACGTPRVTVAQHDLPAIGPGRSWIRAYHCRERLNVLPPVIVDLLNEEATWPFERSAHAWLSSQNVTHLVRCLGMLHDLLLLCCAVNAIQLQLRRDLRGQHAAHLRGRHDCGPVPRCARSAEAPRQTPCLRAL